MHISYKWLKEYVDIKVSPEKLGEILTMAGLPVESMKEKNGDHVLELEVTANRPDWLSHIGVAREVAAITGKKLKLPSICHCEELRHRRWRATKQSLKTVLPRRASPSSQRRVEVKVEDKKLCPRYTARVIRDVKVGESPAWLKERLESMGLRPVNNIVDVTNFCLFETGEPMHAFDLDKVQVNEIIVRKAKKGEKITAIDGVERTLGEDMLIIADSSRPIAIAGVMGALNTEVNYSTKNILLEAAYFDPISIRRTSRKLALTTEASYRFERRVDIENILYSSDRATALICEIAGGRADKATDIALKAPKATPVTLRSEKLSSVLGFDISITTAIKILKALGLSLKSSSKDKATFTSPAFRADLKSEVDLIEEVARVFGYNKIPGTVPPVTETSGKLPPATFISAKVRNILAGLGYDEAITYSLLSKKVIEMSDPKAARESAVTLKNPLSEEQEAMRPDLFPGMLGAALWNINRRNKDIKLFEIGHVYSNEGSVFAEKQQLGLCITGGLSGWGNVSRPYNFFDLKGAVEALFDSLKIEGLHFAPAVDGRFSLGTCASLSVNGKEIGIIGEADRSVLARFDIKEPAYFCEICVESLLSLIGASKKFSQLPKYPAVLRDISIIVDKCAKNSDMIEAITESAGTILKSAKMIDRYSGKQIADGKISLTYRLEYQSPEKTLEEKDVFETHNNILRSLEAKFGAKLR